MILWISNFMTLKTQSHKEIETEILFLLSPSTFLFAKSRSYNSDLVWTGWKPKIEKTHANLKVKAGQGGTSSHQHVADSTSLVPGCLVESCLTSVHDCRYIDMHTHTHTNFSLCNVHQQFTRVHSQLNKVRHKIISVSFVFFNSLGCALQLFFLPWQSYFKYYIVITCI